MLSQGTWEIWCFSSLLQRRQVWQKWKEPFLLARDPTAQQGPDRTAAAVMVLGSPWKHTNRNPSFGMKQTEKCQNKIFVCSNALRYIPTSSPKGCLVQEASVSWAGVNNPSEQRSVPIQPQGSVWHSAQLPCMTVSDGAQGSLARQDAASNTDSAPKIHKRLQTA